MSIQFRDFSRIVLQKINDCGATFLEEVGGELESQVNPTKVVP